MSHWVYLSDFWAHCTSPGISPYYTIGWNQERGRVCLFGACVSLSELCCLDPPVCSSHVRSFTLDDLRDSHSQSAHFSGVQQWLTLPGIRSVTKCRTQCTATSHYRAKHPRISKPQHSRLGSLTPPSVTAETFSSLRRQRHSDSALS